MERVWIYGFRFTICESRRVGGLSANELVTDEFDMSEDVGQADFAVVFASGDERGDGFGEIEGVHLIQGEVAALKGVQQFSVGARAGAEGLEGEDAVAPAPQVCQEQRGQDGFADTGVGAGDKDNASGSPRA